MKDAIPSTSFQMLNLDGFSQTVELELKSCCFLLKISVFLEGLNCSFVRGLQLDNEGIELLYLLFKKLVFKMSHHTAGRLKAWQGLFVCIDLGELIKVFHKREVASEEGELCLLHDSN